MAEELKTITYQDAKGKSREASYYTGQKLTAKREKFCQLVAFGALQREALREAYYSDKPAPSDKALDEMASHLRIETDIVVRIQELKRPVLRKFRKKFEYTLQTALEQCQIAWDIAYSQGDARALLKAVELQGKFMKLLSEQIDVNHRHGLLDDASTQVLLEMRKVFEDKKARGEKKAPILVGNSQIESVDLPQAPF